MLLVGRGGDGAGGLGMGHHEVAVGADLADHGHGGVLDAALAVDADQRKARQRCADWSAQLEEDLRIGTCAVIDQLVDHHLRRRRLGGAFAGVARLCGVAGRRCAPLQAAILVEVAAGPDGLADAGFCADLAAGGFAGLFARAGARADEILPAGLWGTPLQAAVLVDVAARLPLGLAAGHTLFDARGLAGVLAGDGAGAVAAHGALGAVHARAPLQAAVAVEVAALLHLARWRTLLGSFDRAGIAAGLGALALVADQPLGAGHRGAPLQAAVAVVVAAGGDLAQLTGAAALDGALILARGGALARGADLALGASDRGAPLQAAILAVVVAGQNAGCVALGGALGGALILAGVGAEAARTDLGGATWRRLGPVQAAVLVAVAARGHGLSFALLGADGGARILARQGAEACGADLALGAGLGPAPGQAAVAVEVEAGDGFAILVALLGALCGAILIRTFRRAQSVGADLGGRTGHHVKPLETAVAVQIPAALVTLAVHRATPATFGLAGVDAGRLDVGGSRVRGSAVHGSGVDRAGIRGACVCWAGIHGRGCGVDGPGVRAGIEHTGGVHTRWPRLSDRRVGGLVAARAEQGEREDEESFHGWPVAAMVG